MRVRARASVRPMTRGTRQRTGGGGGGGGSAGGRRGGRRRRGRRRWGRWWWRRWRWRWRRWRAASSVHVVHTEPVDKRRVSAGELRVEGRRIALLDPARLVGAAVRGHPVDDRDRGRALVEDDLEVVRPAPTVVVGPPLDDELPVRRAAGRRGEDALARTVGQQIVLVREDRAPRAVDRQRKAAVRVTRVVGRELDVSVRARDSTRVLRPVDGNGEREGERRRAVVAVVPDVGTPR